MHGGLKRRLLTTRAGRIALVAPRAAMALKSVRLGRRLAQVLAWSVRSREIANFTYRTSAASDHLLAGVVAAVTGRPLAEVQGFADELGTDRELQAHVEAMARAPESRFNVDPGFHPGRRLAFYLLARALKPAHVVEAGVDKGLGAVLLSRALARNAGEGRPGNYLGIELDSAKPIALYESFAARQGRIERGDVLAIIRARATPIDLFIHDTTPEAGHMTAVFDAVQPRMAAGGVIASTWTTPTLIDHARGHDLRILSHQEETVDHWFEGDRVGFVYGFQGPNA